MEKNMAALSEDDVAKCSCQSYAHFRVYTEGKNRLGLNYTELKEQECGNQNVAHRSLGG
jgi:hypothetical protein